MIGSILVKMPVITKEFDKSLGIEVINKYFVRLKGDIYIPLFNLPLLYPEVFCRSEDYQRMINLTYITFKYYKEYLKLRKHKQFRLSVFLPEKYGGYALYYLLQKFMIGEATPEEIKIISEFLSRDIFDKKRINMYKLLEQYYVSIWKYDVYSNSILINTPVGVTPLYVSVSFLYPYGLILKTVLENYDIVAFVNVLTSYFFDKNIQIGSTKFNLLKSIGKFDLNWNNVKVVSFKELYDISDAIIKNNLEMACPRTSHRIYVSECLSKGVFLSHSPILSAVGNAVDFRNRSVMFLFAMLKRKTKDIQLTQFNNSFYLNKKGLVSYYVVSIPFKNIKKFIYRDEEHTGIFVTKQDGKTIPVLSLDVWPYWIGVGRKNIVVRFTDYNRWDGLLRKLASPEHLKKAEEKTLEWLQSVHHKDS